MKLPSFVKVIVKWLVITLIVSSGFISILLGLGYLLHENEQETRALQQALETSQ